MREQDRNVIELAIERALDGVKAELEDVAQAETANLAEAPAAAQSAEAPAQAVPEAAAAPIIDPPLPPDQAGAASSVDAAPTQPDGAPTDAAAAPLSQLLARMGPPASLEDLGRAMSASGGRSMDEIAEGIMRPVIRDWLTNNMTAMAERIVREEIERLSRRTG